MDWLEKGVVTLFEIERPVLPRNKCEKSKCKVDYVLKKLNHTAGWGQMVIRELIFWADSICDAEIRIVNTA